MLKVKVNQLKEKLELEPSETEDEDEEEESEITTPTTGLYTEVDPDIPEEVEPTSKSSSGEEVMEEEGKDDGDDDEETEDEEPEEKEGLQEKVRRKFWRLSRLFKKRRHSLARWMNKGKQTIQPSGL